MHGARLADHLQAQLDACSTISDQVMILERLATAAEHQMHAQLGFLRRERDRRAAMLPTDITFGDADADGTA
jgi:hypothetical protein